MSNYNCDGCQWVNDTDQIKCLNKQNQIDKSTTSDTDLTETSTNICDPRCYKFSQPVKCAMDEFEGLC